MSELVGLNHQVGTSNNVHAANLVISCVIFYCTSQYQRNLCQFELKTTHSSKCFLHLFCKRFVMVSVATTQNTKMYVFFGDMYVCHIFRNVSSNFTFLFQDGGHQALRQKTKRTPNRRSKRRWKRNQVLSRLNRRSASGRSTKRRGSKR